MKATKSSLVNCVLNHFLVNLKNYASVSVEMFQNENEVYNCQFCEENIDWHQKENHYGICNKFESFITDHICEFCDKVFDDNIILKKHIQRKHTEPKHSSNEIVSLECIFLEYIKLHL